MATTKIFLTGATGYIGGEALYSLHKAHPDFEYTLLVRDESRGKLVAEKYPDVRFAYGTLSDADVIEKEAAAADIVVHTADSSDDVPSARAIAAGLAAGHTASKPGYWIHVCGTGLLTWYDMRHDRYGEAPLPDQKYHDIDDISRIVSLPRDAVHRAVDEIVLAANDDPGQSVRTLIVGPPTIYGTGRGPVNTRSAQIPRMAKTALENGYGAIVAPGLTEWDHIHVHDLGSFFVLAVDAALNPDLNSNPEIFGPRGYFFLESGTHRWSEVVGWIVEEAAAKGLIAAAETREVGQKTQSWANSKAVAARARKYLGWEPKGKALRDEIVDAVLYEAKQLGKA